MGEFEYLSVLISIVIGLGLSHLLSSAARLIQARGSALWALHSSYTARMSDDHTR